MNPKSDWLQDPSNALGVHVDLDALRARLAKMTDDELLAFGKQMHALVYPLTYDGDGKLSVSAFSIQSPWHCKACCCARFYRKGGRKCAIYFFSVT